MLRTKAHVLAVRDGEHIATAPWQDTQPHHAYAVLELRDDHPLGVREAAALCRPDTVVLTAACDAAALADSLPVGGTLLYNAGDDALRAAVQGVRTDITVIPYDTTDIPCAGLPFATLHPCIAAAEAVGVLFHVEKGTVAAAVRDYAPQGYTQAVLSADGVQLVLHMNCKTQDEARAALQRAPQTARRLAVTTAALADVIRPWATELIVLEDGTDLAAAESALLSLLREGDTLLLCGDRSAHLCTLLRRLFGLTDGFLPDAS